MQFDRRSFVSLVCGAATGFMAGCLGGDDDPIVEAAPRNEIEVSPGGFFIFRPDEKTVDPGTTVVFVWNRSGCNLSVRSKPEESDWEGVPEAKASGFEHEHTFEVEGVYEYVCEAHEDQGMTGRVVVGDPEPP